ncbi:TolC family protein [bacterium]|nr:TolC family protein [bacterium]
MRIIGTVVFVFGMLFSSAQDVLLLENAMKIALENNLGVKMTINQKQQAENIATYGNAGLLPKADLNGGVSLSATNSNLEFAGGTPPIEDVAAQSLSYNGGLGVSYAVFNGLGSLNTFKKLKSQVDIAGIQLNLNIESTLLQVCNVYYEVARQQQQLRIAKNSLDISRERYERVKVGLEYGTVSSLDVLNAEVDMNADSSNVLNMDVGLKNAKRNLNVLLSREVTAQYEVSEVLVVDDARTIEAIQQKALNNNTNLLLAQSNISIAEFDQKIQQAFYMPRVSVNASYGYNYSESNASLILSQSSLGFTGGATLAWSLFDGFKKKTAIQNAQIALETNQLKVDEAKLTVERDVLNAFDLFQNSIILLKVEERSVAAAQLNFDRSKELFNQGQITTTDFRQAQLNLNRAKSRLNTANFITKMAEIELIRLSGELISVG